MKDRDTQPPPAEQVLPLAPRLRKTRLRPYTPDEMAQAVQALVSFERRGRSEDEQDKPQVISLAAMAQGASTPPAAAPFLAVKRNADPGDEVEPDAPGAPVAKVLGRIEPSPARRGKR